MAREYNYKFAKIKPIILFVFGYRCFVCSRFDYKNDVHHYDKNNKNNDAFNLVCVCKDCHLLLHKNLRVALPALTLYQSFVLNEINRLWCGSIY